MKAKIIKIYDYYIIVQTVHDGKQYVVDKRRPFLAGRSYEVGSVGEFTMIKSKVDDSTYNYFTGD